MSHFLTDTKTEINKISFLDLYKERKTEPGTSIGICFTLIFFILAILIFIYVLVDSYTPVGQIPGVGQKVVQKIKYESLLGQKRSITLKFTCDSKGDSPLTRCFFVSEKLSTHIPVPGVNCDLNSTFADEVTVPICNGYSYHIFTNIVPQHPYKEVFGSFSDVSKTLTTPVYFKLTSNQILHTIKLTQYAVISEYGATESSNYLSAVEFVGTNDQVSSSSLFSQFFLPSVHALKTSIFTNYTCSVPDCRGTKVDADTLITTFESNAPRAHVIVWLGKFGSLTSISFTIIGIIVMVILLITKKILGLSPKLETVKRIILLSPKDPKKPNFFNRLINLEFFKEFPSQPGTVFGLMLTILFPILLFILFIYLLVDNYSVKSNQIVIQSDIVSTKGVSIYKRFVCTNPSGCLYVREKFEGSPGNVIIIKAMKTNEFYDMEVESTDFHFIYSKKSYPATNYPKFNNFGYFIDKEKTIGIINGYAVGDTFGKSFLTATKITRKNSMNQIIFHDTVFDSYVPANVDQFRDPISEHTPKITPPFPLNIVKQQTVVELGRLNNFTCDTITTPGDCFGTQLLLQSLMKETTFSTASKDFIALVAEFGGYFTLIKSIFATSMLVYVYLTFYFCNSCYQRKNLEKRKNDLKSTISQPIIIEEKKSEDEKKEDVPKQSEFEQEEASEKRESEEKQKRRTAPKLTPRELEDVELEDKVEQSEVIEPENEDRVDVEVDATSDREEKVESAEDHVEVKVDEDENMKQEIVEENKDVNEVVEERTVDESKNSEIEPETQPEESSVVEPVEDEKVESLRKETAFEGSLEKPEKKKFSIRKKPKKETLVLNESRIPSFTGDAVSIEFPKPKELDDVPEVKEETQKVEEVEE
eukprot:gene3620-6436_t